MDKIHEIAGDVAQMSRFDDDMVNMAELIRVMPESLVNVIMASQADEACEAGNRRRCRPPRAPRGRREAPRCSRGCRRR